MTSDDVPETAGDASAALQAASIARDGYVRIRSVETNKGKRLLHPMEIKFPEGSVTAIMGPSGSGKTTMLSVLTDAIQSNINAIAEVNLPGASAIVPQDDRLHGFYTVKSYMKHYSRLTGMKQGPELDEKIDQLLVKLGLTDQADTIVGDLFLKGLSGGQKRRLSVGLEALTDPGNFFLDEPTSGLDAESALQVMEFLKGYARSAAGRRVILTIHQPSTFIWELIDNVVLLSKGKLVFQGGRQDMETFFESAGYPTQHGWNPADHYVTMVNDEFRASNSHSVEVWAQKYEEWEQAVKDGKNLEGKRAASLVRNFQQEEVTTKRSSAFVVIGELTYRYFLNLWFNPGILGTRLVMYTMLASMVGALFWGLGDRHDYESIISRAAVAFYCVAFFVFMCVAVLPFTVIERDIVDKEVHNKYYHPTMYQAAQALSSIPGTAVLACLVTVIVCSMLNLNDPYWYYLNMFLSLMVAEALAQLVSHVVPHFVIGMALLAGLFGFFMLFQGFMLVPSDFPSWLKWTYYVAFHTYSWRSFMVTEFRGDLFPGTGFETGEDVLISYEIEEVNRGNDMIVLLCYGLIVHLLSFIVLHARHTMFRGKLVPPGKTASD